MDPEEGRLVTWPVLVEPLALLGDRLLGGAVRDHPGGTSRLVVGSGEGCVAGRYRVSVDGDEALALRYWGPMKPAIWPCGMPWPGNM